MTNNATIKDIRDRIIEECGAESLLSQRKVNCYASNERKSPGCFPCPSFAHWIQPRSWNLTLSSTAIASAVALALPSSVFLPLASP
jgi:hypothetical protein